jgi:hypothetical protein
LASLPRTGSRSTSRISPRSIGDPVNFSPPQINSLPDGRHQITIAISAIGPEALYEVELTLVKQGASNRPIGGTTPILQVGSKEITHTFITEAPLVDNWLVIEWFEPSRKGAVLDGMRVSLDIAANPHPSLWWLRWRLPWWP